jgi:ubiquinone/menaquinone biosynthesis C-methylase UbiE
LTHFGKDEEHKMKRNHVNSNVQKGYKGMAMEGLIARWYAHITKPDEELESLAQRLSELVSTGSRVLEVAPGPGYLSIALAKLGNCRMVGLDISQTFVEIARANARAAGVEIEFRQGNASDMPFNNETFAFIFCRAAFKNFTQPVRAIQEMYRVLRSNGKAVIFDLRRDASQEAIDTYVNNAGLSRINTLITKWTFRHMLLKRAYTKGEIQEFVSHTDFHQCRIGEDPIGMELWLEKQASLRKEGFL